MCILMQLQSPSCHLEALQQHLKIKGFRMSDMICPKKLKRLLAESGKKDKEKVMKPPIAYDIQIKLGLVGYV
jgi:hypothetical protein